MNLVNRQLLPLFSRILIEYRQPNQNTKGRYIIMISHDTTVVTMLFILCQQGEQIGIIVTIDEY
jgi:hypothetical protein